MSKIFLKSIAGETHIMTLIFFFTFLRVMEIPLDVKAINSFRVTELQVERDLRL